MIKAVIKTVTWVIIITAFITLTWVMIMTVIMTGTWVSQHN